MRQKRILIVFLLLLGGYTVITFMFGREDNSRLLAEALAHFSTVESFSGDVRIETIVDIDLGGGVLVGDIRLLIGIAGPVGVHFPATGKMSGWADFVIGPAEGKGDSETEIAVHWITDMSGDSYLLLENFPVSEGDTLDFSSLNGTWFRLTPSIVASVLSGDVVVGDGSVTDGAASAGAVAKLRDMITKEGLITRSYPMVSEIIDGESTRHFQVDLERGQLKRFLVEAKRLMVGRQLIPEESAGISTMLDSNDIHVEVWISKETRTLKRLGFDIRPHEGIYTSPVRVILDFDSFTHVPQRSAPEDARSLEDFLGSLVQKTMGARVE